jgi:hypothetical protein
MGIERVHDPFHRPVNCAVLHVRSVPLVTLHPRWHVHHTYPSGSSLRLDRFELAARGTHDDEPSVHGGSLPVHFFFKLQEGVRRRRRKRGFAILSIASRNLWRFETASGRLGPRRRSDVSQQPLRRVDRPQHFLKKVIVTLKHLIRHPPNVGSAVSLSVALRPVLVSVAARQGTGPEAAARALVQRQVFSALIALVLTGD